MSDVEIVFYESWPEVKNIFLLILQTYSADVCSFGSGSVMYCLRMRIFRKKRSVLIFLYSLELMFPN